MRRIVFVCALFVVNICSAQQRLIATNEELNAAVRSAQPGDTIVLRNGTWMNLVMKFNCSGTEKQPIVFKAQTPGKVIVSGVSQLRLGGNYIVVDGLLFTNGYSPSNSVIDFKISNKELANHCRVTNCVVNDFNQPKRMDEDQWVSFSGKNNRLDHCSFFNKKNMGVLLAVLLDDDRSRENFHSIDHNYFGIRPPLGSNGGEMIRVGVSQHCQFNSNTQIRDNFFEYCDGETEIVSIKSGANVVSNNVFKECQGSVVLRHGDNNTVTNNLFLGNGKEATGGVRIINKGQWVINNFFYQCRGESFRSPLAIMNGIPNSPANRYVQVTDAVVMNNTFVDCAPMSLGEGSDKERTLPPANVLFAKNIFYNSKDANVYKAWDEISGIRFAENKISRSFTQSTAPGFEVASFGISKVDAIRVPTAGRSGSDIGLDSLMAIDKERLPAILPAPGFTGLSLLRQLETNAYANCGAKWFAHATVAQTPATVSCANASELYRQLKKQGLITVRLTGASYQFDRPIEISDKIHFTADRKKTIQFVSTEKLPALFLIRKKGNLVLDNLNLQVSGLNADAFVASDAAGSAEHFNLKMDRVTITGLTHCNAIFQAAKSTFADSIVIQNCIFRNILSGILMTAEKDDKGYYNAEKIRIVNNQFSNSKGVLLAVYRGGNDESTLGPNLIFNRNDIAFSNTENADPLIQFTGVQKTRLTDNRFINSNDGKPLIAYKDTVRASHVLAGNSLVKSGTFVKNNFVEEKNTTLR